LKKTKTLLIIATLDTKGREAAYVKKHVQKCGVDSLLTDIGTLGKPFVHPDISAYEVARAGGFDLKEIIRKKNRTDAVRAMQEGGAIIAAHLVKQKKIHGVIGMGGGTGTAVISYIMRSLPFGLPKVLVSTVASRNIREFIETKDIVMFHSVADILGFNEFIRHILSQAAYAVCGMMEKGSAIRSKKPMIAVTAYGVSSMCALNAEPFLRQKGYEMIGFHANGVGGMAMEEMISQGLIAGVLDFTPHEIADEMFGGYCRGIGPARFETAAKMGVPLVFAPGGLDNAVFSPFYPMPVELEGRKIHHHDIRFCVRMGSSEMKKFACIIGEKLNMSVGPVHVCIPKKGWSEADKPGMELFDPEANQVFIDELKNILRSDIPFTEFDVHISDPEFAEKAVGILHRMIEKKS
jgi:uncharacterized protein (UPF0261 family)